MNDEITANDVLYIISSYVKWCKDTHSGSMQSLLFYLDKLKHDIDVGTDAPQIYERYLPEIDDDD